MTEGEILLLEELVAGRTDGEKVAVRDEVTGRWGIYDDENRRLAEFGRQGDAQLFVALDHSLAKLLWLARAGLRAIAAHQQTNEYLRKYEQELASQLDPEGLERLRAEVEKAASGRAFEVPCNVTMLQFRQRLANGLESPCDGEIRSYRHEAGFVWLCEHHAKIMGKT